MCKKPPTEERAGVVKLFPTNAQWIKGYGYVEIGDEIDLLGYHDSQEFPG